MNEYLKYNLCSYLHKDSKKCIILWIIISLLSLIFLFYSYTHYSYNVYETNAETLCIENKCSIHFYYPIIDSFQYDFIKINDQEYQVESIFFDEVVFDSSNVGIQNITLNVKEYKGNNKEIVKLKIYKNKERLIKKIFKIIFER